MKGSEGGVGERVLVKHKGRKRRERSETRGEEEV